MPDGGRLVINTGPLISLIAACGSLEILRDLYDSVLVPHEVEQEILAQSASRFGASEFEVADWLVRQSAPVAVPAFLRNALDSGEAAVIQLALQEGINRVCIDEPVGRRIARLNGLRLTGSLGILLRAKAEGHGISLSTSIRRMQDMGIHLGSGLIESVLRQAGEWPPG